MSTSNREVGRQPTFRILVPLDGSEQAESALPIAEQLATQLGVDLELIQVLPFPVLPFVATAGYLPGDVYEQVAADQQRRAREELEGVAARARKHGVPVVNIHIERGETAQTLIEMATSVHAGLVVMTTHGRTGLTRFALGSVADRVVRSGTVPVLLIRSSSTPDSSSTLEQVVVPLDGSTLAETALDLTVQLAGPVVREITLLRVADHRDGSEAVLQAESYLNTVHDQLVGRLFGRDCHIRQLVLTGNPAECIVNCAEANGKLTIMATHGEAGIGRWTMGSIADRVLRDGRTPLVLVHPARG